MKATRPLSVSTVRSADCACAVASRPFLSSSATRSKPANAAPNSPARRRNARRDRPLAFAPAPATRCMRGKLRHRRGGCVSALSIFAGARSTHEKECEPEGGFVKYMLLFCGTVEGQRAYESLSDEELGSRHAQVGRWFGEHGQKIAESNQLQPPQT